MKPDSSLPLEKLQNFFSRGVLVAHASAGTRALIGKTIETFIQKPIQILTAGHRDEAIEILSRSKPPVVFSDYELSPTSGLELIEEIKKLYPLENERFFGILTHSFDRGAVLDTAEHDLDLFILKPFTQKILATILMDVMKTKFTHSEYLKCIANGKASIQKNEIDDAIEFFDAALKAHSRPSAAHYFLGKIFEEEDTDTALTHYRDALAKDPLHYGCLCALFDLEFKEKRYEAAYKTGKTIEKQFQLSPDRLIAALRLSIETGTYKSINAYFEKFHSTVRKSPKLRKTMTAALATKAQLELSRGQPKAAADSFQKAVLASGEPDKILRESLYQLSKFGHLEIAKSLYSTNKGTDPNSTETALNSLVLQAFSNDPQKILLQAKDLLQKKKDDPYLYVSMILALNRLQRAELAINTSKAASKKYPDFSELFEEALQIRIKKAPHPTAPN